jgi:phthalate 4,5-dioxygenase oxygenase subunit
MLITEIKKAESGASVFLELSEAEAAEVTGPATVDGIGPASDTGGYWRSVDQRRRDNAPWLAPEAEAGAAR